MRKIFWSLFFLLFISLGAYAVEEKTTLRVGISNSSFSLYEHTSAGFIVQGVSSIINMDNGSKKEISANSQIEAKFLNGRFYVDVNGKREVSEAKGPIVIASADKIGIKNLKRKGSPAYYKGMIELTPINASRFNIVNVIDMQSYLKGVVPNEMPITFGFEALKAQAVAARNYANRPNTIYPNYDVCDSTACQVYYGVNSQTETSDAAVDETLGIYALYDNEIILALYSSTASGITESYYNTFGDFEEERPYLVSVKDSNVLGLVSTEELFKNKLLSFDMNSPKYRWERTYTKAQLEEILSKNLAEQSRAGFVTPEFPSGRKLAGLEDIIVLKRGDSGKALEVQIKSKSGNYTVRKELAIRRLFKQGGQFLPSANFIVEKEYAMPSKVEEKTPVAPVQKEEAKETDPVKTAIEENISKETVSKEPVKIAENEDDDVIFKSEKRKNEPQDEIKEEIQKEINEAPIEKPDFKPDFKPETAEGKELLQPTPKTMAQTATQTTIPKAAPQKTKNGPLLSLTLYGAGFGHGVGMSQYGAGFLSSYGVGYENILKHYYKGIKLGTVPKTVEYNNLGLDYIQEFYFSKKKPKGEFLNHNKTDLKEEIETLLAKKKIKKCYLTIENEDRATSLEFYINDYHFNPDFRQYRKKVFTSEITNYLKEGVNKITFSPLDESDKRKNVRFYITIGEADDEQPL